MELAEGLQVDNLEVIVINGYKVRCAYANQIEKLYVKMIDGVGPDDDEKIVHVPIVKATCVVKFPNLASEPVNGKWQRCKRRMQFSQFPLNCANCRTCHKLQGRSIDNLFLTCASYVSNWLYVALSRVRTLNGLFLRSFLTANKCKGMSPENLNFHKLWRKEKAPPDRVELATDDFVTP